MSLGQDRLTFAAVLVAAGVAVFGYMQLGSVFNVSGEDVSSQEGLAGEGVGGGEMVRGGDLEDASGERPGDDAERLEGADHRVEPAIKADTIYSGE